MKGFLFCFKVAVPTKLYNKTVVLDEIFHICVLGQRNIGFPHSFQAAVRFEEYCLLRSDVISLMFTDVLEEHGVSIFRIEELTVASHLRRR